MANFPFPKQDRGGVARLRELDVEPLSELRWEKIEQGIFARLDSTSGAASMVTEPSTGNGSRARRWLAPAAVAACLLVACLAFAINSLQSPTSSLSRIATGATGSRVGLPGIVLDVSPESAVVISGSAAESQLVVLDRGTVTCDVAHRRPGVPLIVQAGEVQVEVVGTRFSVTRVADIARVVVQEGVVKVSARGQTTRVHAGESWPEAARVAAAPAPVQAKEIAPPPTAPVESPSLMPTVVRPRAVAPKRVLSPTSSEEAPTPPPAPPAPPDLQSSFEAAARLEAKDPARAIQLYRELESGSGSWANNALFAHGRLLAARGSRAEARRVLQQYLARSPHGPNAADARLLLGRLE